MKRSCCGLASDPHAPKGEHCMDCQKKLCFFNRRHEALGVDGPLCTKCVNARAQDSGQNFSHKTNFPPSQETSEVTNSLGDRSLPSTPAQSHTPNASGSKEKFCSSSSPKSGKKERSKLPKVQEACSRTPVKSKSKDRNSNNKLQKFSKEDDEDEDDEEDMSMVLSQFADRMFEILGGPWGRVGAPVTLIVMLSFVITGISLADFVYFLLGLVLVTPILHSLQGNPKTAVTRMHNINTPTPSPVYPNSNPFGESTPVANKNCNLPQFSFNNKNENKNNNINAPELTNKIQMEASVDRSTMPNSPISTNGGDTISARASSFHNDGGKILIKS